MLSAQATARSRASGPWYSRGVKVLCHYPKHPFQRVITKGVWHSWHRYRIAVPPIGSFVFITILACFPSHPALPLQEIQTIFPTSGSTRGGMVHLYR